MSFKVFVRKHWRYIVVSLALLAGVTIVSQSVFASASNGRTLLDPLCVPVTQSSGHTQQSVQGAITDTPSSTSILSGSAIPTPAMLLVGHVIWEGIPQPNARNIQPI